ncbi:TetR/AcrR family transcriptional regulator [Devosia sp.]|uniref:TetR/AcrR family transcriptional regulator n=1 Tax=Devosia sp. TaxID=1871048 RepID=UPI003264D02A
MAKLPASRPLRADARQNEDALLQAAKAVFAVSGVDAPIREIALEAGVGLATLYRRFPKRTDLIAAVFRREVDLCVAEAATLRASQAPAAALHAWLLRYADFIATKQGLAAALHSGDPAFAGLPDYFRANFEPALGGLLKATDDNGAIRDDVLPYDLLRAIGNLSVASGEDGRAHVERMVGLIFDGLRYGRSSQPEN